MRRFFIDHYSLQKSKDFFLKINRHIETLQQIGRTSSREYADSMETVRAIVPELSELEKHIDLAYAERNKETLKNLPFEFYTKLVQIDASVNSQWRGCVIM